MLKQLLKMNHLNSLNSLKSFQRRGYHSDTIYGLSTGHIIKAGISIIRISGKQSFNILNSLINKIDNNIDNNNNNNNKTKSIGIKPKYATLKRLICPKTNELLDKGIVLWFRL